MRSYQTIMQNIRAQPLAWLVQIVGVIFFIGNLYMATQLFPLIRNIDSLVSRVNAIEERNVRVEPLVNEFIEIKGTFKAMQEDIKEIKADIKYIIELTR